HGPMPSAQIDSTLEPHHFAIAATDILKAPMRVDSVWIAGLLVATCAAAQHFPISEPGNRELERINYHRVTSRGSPAPEPGAENTVIPSPLDKLGGGRVGSADEWYGRRRPELVKTWTAILGKIAPAPEDRKWFGDVTKVSPGRSREMDGY